MPPIVGVGIMVLVVVGAALCYGVVLVLFAALWVAGKVAVRDAILKKVTRAIAENNAHQVHMWGFFIFALTAKEVAMLVTYASCAPRGTRDAGRTLLTALAVHGVLNVGQLLRVSARSGWLDGWHAALTAAQAPTAADLMQALGDCVLFGSAPVLLPHPRLTDLVAAELARVHWKPGALLARVHWGSGTRQVPMAHPSRAHCATLLCHFVIDTAQEHCRWSDCRRRWLAACVAEHGTLSSA